MPLTSGSKLGPYEILDVLGAGGMGEVYRAKDARLNRIVAIKVLPASFSTEGDRLQRFAVEPFLSLGKELPTGAIAYDALVSPDGRAYVYEYDLETEAAFVVKGLK